TRHRHGHRPECRASLHRPGRGAHHAVARSCCRTGRGTNSGPADATRTVTATYESALCLLHLTGRPPSTRWVGRPGKARRGGGAVGDVPVLHRPWEGVDRHDAMAVPPRATAGPRGRPEEETSMEATNPSVQALSAPGR